MDEPCEATEKTTAEIQEDPEEMVVMGIQSIFKQPKLRHIFCMAWRGMAWRGMGWHGIFSHGMPYSVMACHIQSWCHRKVLHSVYFQEQHQLTMKEFHPLN